jgi:hypothetical protein
MRARLARHALKVETDGLPIAAAAQLGAPAAKRMWASPPEHVVVAHKV